MSRDQRAPDHSKIKVWVSAQISREMVPIARVACEPGDFQPQDQPDLPQSDFGNEPLEAQGVDRGSSRVAQILINHDNALVSPSQRTSSLTQRIVAIGTFRVL